MKKIIISFAFLVKSMLCFAQTELMVVVKSGIVIRESATIKSKPIGSIKFGEMVDLLYEAGIADTVNEMPGKWVKVKHGKHSGYIFDQYLGNFEKHNKNFPKNFPQYFDLHANCGEQQYFNSDFYWYGVFENKSMDNLKVSRVMLDFSVKKENWRDEMYDQYLKISVQSSDEPLFLIGLPDSIPDYEIQKSEIMTRKLDEIYPGQSLFISSYLKPEVSYSLVSFGHYIEWNSGIKDYKIEILKLKYPNIKIKSQNILANIENPIYEGLPKIKFVGDLNHDFTPDIIISHNTGHSSANTYLLMSGYSQNDLVSIVALNKWGGCY